MRTLSGQGDSKGMEENNKKYAVRFYFKPSEMCAKKPRVEV